ncbi:MAG TPA: OmpA family protein [Terriglobales bacterium]|nr:OmpA family protein [Terriglobales bacterium]
MRRPSLREVAWGVGLCVLVIALGAVMAETAKVEGFIIGRSGDEMIVQFAGGAELAFLLTDSTQVSQVEGPLKARKKKMSMAALVPGLKVQAEGTYNERRQLVATSVKFKGDDLEHAEAAQAGMHETKMQVQANKEELERQAAELKAQREALEKQQAEVAANKAAIDAATARFGQLDDYYILDEVTVYFSNGKVKLDPQYHSPLLALAQKAQSVNGYMIEVKGYASSAGSASLNQKLSEDRASSVTNFLMQQGHVPLTRMLAPGAMGEAHQVGNDKSAEGQAENRRVVVRVLQNKAIAGV